ncbi:MAG: D-glycero-beta-D-manno-heptose 1-phosphate adenylyltransferase [Niastella sp.]|nr:D-glycero-beta-D-manno-heptose 1-phosphate adenylyltransferase [Niastella sp.]
MRQIQAIPNKIFDEIHLQQELKRWRLHRKKIVFTNGVFDLLHQGHIASLCEAASLGDILIVGVNSDASVKRLKGNNRPVLGEQERALILASLLMTDAVVIFETDTPKDLITSILPDVLVKGGDYTIDAIAGAKEVIAAGGHVHLAKMVKGISTSVIIEKLKNK